MTFRSMAERFHKVSTWNKKMKNYEYNSYNISNYFRRVSKILNIFSWYKRFTCNCTLMSSGIYLVSLVLVSSSLLHD